MQSKQAVKHLLVALSITLVIMLGLSIYGCIQIPDGQRIPIQWNLKGEAGNYTSKHVGLFCMPAIMTVIGVILSLVPLIDPRRLNILQSLKAYQIVTITLFIVMAFLHAAIIANALYQGIDVFCFICGCIAILFLVIGNYMGKVKSNFFFGVRTPWTLSSELSWNKTHRLCGKLFFIHGIILLIGCFTLQPNHLSQALLTGALLNAGVSVAYSYFVWKTE